MIKRTVLLALLLALAGSATACQTNKDTESTASESISVTDIEESPEPDSEEIAQTEISVDRILMAIEAAYSEEYPANEEIPEELLATEFGLAPDMYEEAKGVMAMISTMNDRIVVVQAKPDRVDDVENALLEARQRKIDDTLQYPMNIPKTNAAKVVRNGDYIAFLLVGRIDDSIEDAQSEEALQHAEDEVQIAVDTFNSVFES